MMGVVVKDFGEPARRGGAVSRGCYDGSQLTLIQLITRKLQFTTYLH